MNKKKISKNLILNLVQMLLGIIIIGLIVRAFYIEDYKSEYWIIFVSLGVSGVYLFSNAISKMNRYLLTNSDYKKILFLYLLFISISILVPFVLIIYFDVNGKTLTTKCSDILSLIALCITLLTNIISILINHFFCAKKCRNKRYGITK